MGFSVTAAHAIFFVAGLTAASAALDVVWHTSGRSTEARADWQRYAASQVDTNLTLSVNLCNGGCDPPDVPMLRLDVRNSGTTVVDYRNLTYVIDGRAHTVENVTDYDIVGSNTVTDLILPGETMRIEFQNVVISGSYSAATIPVQVITLDGVIGRR